MKVPPKHYENMRDASLSEYMNTDITRLVSESMRNIHAGITEVPLEVQLQPKTAAKLSFYVPWDGILYGFIRGKEALRKKLGFSLPLLSATISDWNGKFVLIFETEKPDQTAAFRISEKDVLYLLEHCRRPPETEKNH